MADAPFPIDQLFEFATRKVVTLKMPLFTPEGGSVPELTKQWHLKYLGDIGKVWQDYTGKGISVGVYDEGVQKSHWDLAANYDASKEVFIDGQTTATVTGPHGTSVAGLIAAARNGEGGVGVAYDAKVTGVDVFSGPAFINGTDLTNFHLAIQQAAGRFDVINNSYGANAAGIPLRTEYSRVTPNTFFFDSVRDAEVLAGSGRGGLGTINVHASGNSNAAGEALGDNSTRYIVNVGAYREKDGAPSAYSNFGPSLLVSAPSNDFARFGGTGVVTTDLLGAAGYDSGDYTNAFGGTSAASPIVAGVAALILDANENLGWRDVSNILAASAKMPIAFGTGVTAYVNASGQGALLNNGPATFNGQNAGWNGGAMHYSSDYGFGAVDAYNAVRMAEVWSLFGAAKTSANEVTASVSADVGLTSLGAANITATVPEASAGLLPNYKSFQFELGQNIDIEHVDLSLVFKEFASLELRQNGQILGSQEGFNGLFASQFKLIAPDGTAGFAWDQGLFEGNLTDAAQEFTLGFRGFRGVESKGTWTLQFANYDAEGPFVGDVIAKFMTSLTVEKLKMDVYGSTPTNDDVYTYTNEFFDMASIAGQAGRKTLADTDGGTDWINAAAVSSDIKLSLVGGQGTSFGGQRAFTLSRDSVIEGAVTGDGNDTLIGNRFDNKLYGMRGNDVLNGGAGNDTLFGGTGSDRFLFDNRGVSGKDVVLDWTMGDLIGTQTALRGVGADGKLTVAANATLLLDGTAAGDTARLTDNGGAVLQSVGQKDGYFWYAYISGSDLDSNDVIREAGFQPSRVAAGSVAAIAVTADADHAASAPAFATTGAANDQGAFYLYDPMAASMAGGVQLYA